MEMRQMHFPKQPEKPDLFEIKKRILNMNVDKVVLVKFV
jgi:hypothetical protein